MTKQILAYDAVPTFRWIDTNGRLHVDKSNFTRVQVAPYYGEDIPHWREKGLDPKKVYKAYRPPEELGNEETIKSIVGIPVQLNHNDDYPNAPASETRVGSTGDSPFFDGEFLGNSIHIQNKNAIDRINDGSMAQLSLAYAYDPDFTPGKTPTGQEYDFVMRNIRGQHLALVPRGRAGYDCCVHDHDNITLGGHEVDTDKVDEKLVNEKAAEVLEDAADNLKQEAAPAANGDENDMPDIEKLVEAVKANANAETLKALVEAVKDGGDTAEIGSLIDHAFEKPAENEDEEDPALTDEAEDEEEDPQTNPQEEDDETEDEEDLDEVFKAAGIENASDEEKAMFLKGMEHAQSKAHDEKDESAETEPAPIAKDAAIDMKALEKKAEQRFYQKQKAVEKCARVLGKVKTTAYDSAGAIYVDALKHMGFKMKGITAENAQLVYEGYMRGLNMASEGLARDAADDAAVENDPILSALSNVTNF